MKRLSMRLLLLLMFSMLAVPTMAQDDTIIDIVEDLAGADEDAEFTILLDLLEEADLDDMLDEEDVEHTLFAPTDEAFADLMEEMDLELDDLQENVDLISEVLLYHMVGGVLESGDLENGQAIISEQGDTLIISIDEETVLINGIAEIIEVNIEASNGIIHIIDAVLIPAVGSGQVCMVSTDVESGARVRVGPGNNRTSVTFLETGVQYEVLGRNEDSEGIVWYQLNKDEAAPGRAINEAWVSSEEVNSTGNCDTIGETAAPPLIPIVNQPPASRGETTADEDESASTNPVEIVNSGARPASGTYSVVFAEYTNASCAGRSNVPIPSTDFWTSTSFLVSVDSAPSSMTFGGDLLTYSNGTYSGQIFLQGEYYTTSVYPSNTNYFSGTVIVSFISGGQNCSGTVNFSATRQ